MEDLTYFRSGNVNEVADHIRPLAKKGWVLAGPIRSFIYPKWQWLFFSFGPQVAYEVTMILPKKES